MRKILISVLVFLFIVFTAFLLVKGVGFLNLEGFKGLDAKNNLVEEKIAALSKVVNTTYPNALSNLKKAQTNLMTSKTNYENKAIALNSNKSSYALQLEPYDIDYLWTKLGNYAKDENVVIKIDVKQSGISSDLYDLNFSVTGNYSDITDFIYDIENDSKLGFKIDDFKMTGSSTGISATFTCTDIPIDLKELKTKTTEDKKEEEPKDDKSSTTNKANTTNASSAVDADDIVNSSDVTSNSTTTNSNSTTEKESTKTTSNKTE